MASEPTVPKRIEPPFTLPWMSGVPGGLESLIVPFSFDPDCVHFSVNEPWKVPL